MKSRNFILAMTIAVVTAMTISTDLTAQHTRYKIIDLGTLGGTNSYQESPGQTVNNRGEIIAFSDTDIPDPNCFEPDCLISHAIKWDEGAPVDLGALPGVNDSVPTWITAGGLIAGLSENGDIDPLTGFPEFRAVLWNKEGTITNLGTLGGNSSQGFGVNSRGQVVGVALNTTPDPFCVVMAFLPCATQARAFLWQNGSMYDLGTLGSGNDADAQGVNERGQVVGYSFTDTSPNGTTGIPTVHPFLWENNNMVDLGTLGGTIANPGPILLNNGFPAPAINNRGQVVGSSTLAGDQTWHPFLWDNGVLKDLGTLGGTNGEAFWLSNSGLVVGRAEFSLDSTNHHAFLWKNGVMTDLGVLAPCRNSTASGVNSVGQAVGDTGDCPGDGHPFLSEHGEPMVDLNTLVLPGSDLTLTAAAFINDRGEIAGAGVLPNGDMRAVLLVPASESEIAAASAFPVAKAAPITKSPTLSAESPQTPSGMATWRARLAQRYRIPGLRPAFRQ